MYGCVSIYPTPQSMQDKVDEYFNFLEVYNEGKRKKKPPTMTGLARYLGFTSRSQFVNYKNEENPLFEDIVAQARMRIEEFYEEELITTKGNASGLIFALKNNAKWEEVNKTRIGGEDDKPLIFTWDPNAADVIDNRKDVKTIDVGVKGVLPGGIPQLESPGE